MSLAEKLKRDLLIALQTFGAKVTYRSKTQSGEDDYGKPIYTWETKEIYIALSTYRPTEARTLEAGYVPEEYFRAIISFEVQPKVGDQVVHQGETYVITAVNPWSVGDTVIYYETMMRKEVEA